MRNAEPRAFSRQEEREDGEAHEPAHGHGAALTRFHRLHRNAQPGQKRPSHESCGLREDLLRTTADELGAFMQMPCSIGQGPDHSNSDAPKVVFKADGCNMSIWLQPRHTAAAVFTT